MDFRKYLELYICLPEETFLYNSYSESISIFSDEVVGQTS